MSTHFWFGGEANPYLVKNSVKLDEGELTRTPSETDPHEYGESGEIATANSTVANSSVNTKVFDVQTYTGNGSTQTITTGTDLAGEGGLVWIKSRTSDVNHALFDTVRGAGQILSSNLTNAESSNSGFTSFNSNGFELGGHIWVNGVGNDFISWSFRKAPNFFDIVEYSGTGSVQQIPHNLGSKPGMIIVKSTAGAARNWAVYHKSEGATHYALLNNTGTFNADNTYWDDTEPTDTHFTVGTASGTNMSGVSWIAYVFGDTPGTIKQGSYVGDGSTSHQIDVGFQPQFVLIKATDGTGGWIMADAQRPNNYLHANLSNGDSGGTVATYNSTGFELKVAGAALNGNNINYIYMAIADPGYIDIDATVSATTLAFNNPTSLDNDLKTELFAVGDKVQQDEPYIATTDDVSSVEGGGGYQVQNSVMFNGTNTNLIKNYTQQNTDPKKFTLSFWFKRTKLAYEVVFGTQLEVSAGDYVELSFQADNKMSFYGRTGGVSARVDTGAQIEVGAWTHCVIAVDTTIQSPESDRVKIYLNGEEQTNLYNVTYPTQNFEYTFFDDSSKDWMIGDNLTVGDALYGPSSCYMADWQFVDGQQLNALVFGEYDSNGVWTAKDAAALGTTSVITSATDTQLVFTDDTNLAAGTVGNVVTQTGSNTPTSSDVTGTVTNTDTLFIRQWDRTLTGRDFPLNLNDAIVNSVEWTNQPFSTNKSLIIFPQGNESGAVWNSNTQGFTGNSFMHFDANGNNIGNPGGSYGAGEWTSFTWSTLLNIYNLQNSAAYIVLGSRYDAENNALNTDFTSAYVGGTRSTEVITLTDNTGLSDFRTGDSVSQSGSYTPETSAITNVAESSISRVKAYYSAVLPTNLTEAMSGTEFDLTLRNTNTVENSHYLTLICEDGCPTSGPVFQTDEGPIFDMKWSGGGGNFAADGTRLDSASNPPSGPSSTTSVVFGDGVTTGYTVNTQAAYTVIKTINLGTAPEVVDAAQYTESVLTLTDDTDLDNLRVGDVETTGNTITAINSGTPSITVNGGTWSNGETVTGPTVTPGNGIVTDIDTGANTLSVNDTSAGTDRWTTGTGRNVTGPTITSAVGTITATDIANDTLDITTTSGRFFAGSTAEIELGYGQNGFHLDFSGSDLGVDASTSDNDWTANNLGADPWNPSGPWPGFRTSGPQQSWNQGTDSNVFGDAYTHAISGNTNGIRIDTQQLGSDYNFYIRYVSGNTIQVFSTNDADGTGLTTHTSGTTGNTIISSGGGSTYSYGRYITVEGSGSGNTTVELLGYVGRNSTTVDSPTLYGTDTGAGNEVRGNYCTLNPLNKGRGTLSSGSLTWQTGNDSANNSGIILGTIGVSSGKWYWEVIMTAATGVGSSIGIADTTHVVDPNGDGQGLGTSPGSYAYLQDARKYNNNATTSYGDSYVVGDVIGVALDMDNGTLTFYKNGTSQGQAYSGLSGTFFPGLSDFNNQITWDINFGQKSWKYQAPAGYKALTTGNFE